MHHHSPTLPRTLFYVAVFVLVVIVAFYSLLRVKDQEKNVNTACKNCNVLIISIGTLRADHLPCFGYGRDTMPNLCNFAKENILFKNFYSQSNFTLDDYMSLITSLYPYSHQVTTAYKDSLSRDIETLPQTLKNQGYETIYVGPEDDPTIPLTKGFERGFDEIIKSDGNFDDLVNTLKNNQNTDDTKKPFFIFFHSYGAHAPYTLPNDHRSTLFVKNSKGIPETESDYQKFDKDFLKYAINTLRERVGKSDTRESLKRNTFLYKGLNDATNLVKAKEFFDQNMAPDLKSLFYNYYFENINKNDPNIVSALVDLYDEKLRSVDNGLQDLLAYINDAKNIENTVVIITTDHGEEFTEHGELDHIHNVYETETHIPLIMAIPGHKKITFAPLSQTIDISPTLLRAIDIPIPVQFQGKNLFPYLSGFISGPENNFVISEQHGSKIKTIRLGKWRLYVNGDNYSVSQLFDIDADHDEQHNLILSRKEIADKLKNTIENILGKAPIYENPRSNFPDWIDSKEREKLIKEGYF